jgi:sugar phosphate isomerase/epimerase
MKLSIVLSAQPAAFSALAYQAQFEKNVAKIAALGFDGVELAVRDPSLLDLSRIKDHLRANHLSVPAIAHRKAH